MSKKVKNVQELIGLAKQDIINTMDSVGYHLFNHTESFIYNAYRKECPVFWPMYDADGEPIKNPKTGAEFAEDERPDKLAHLLRSNIRREVGGDPHARSVKVWVDTEGLPNAENMEIVGRLMEAYGCRPWGRLKSHMDSGAGIKAVSDKAKRSERKMIFGKI